MKYYINYTEQGKIVGFLTTESDTDLNIEVSNAIWFEAQRYNKIIVDGDNISFHKVDWRTEEEIKEEEINTQIAEAKTYLASTDFYMTVDKYATLTADKQLELTTKRAEARKLINTLEIELEGL